MGIVSGLTWADIIVGLMNGVSSGLIVVAVLLRIKSRRLRKVVTVIRWAEEECNSGNSDGPAKRAFDKAIMLSIMTAVAKDGARSAELATTGLDHRPLLDFYKAHPDYDPLMPRQR